jgi:hypothetical protein
MSRPYRRWTPVVIHDIASIFTPAQRGAIEKRRVHADDEDDAASEMLAVLGIELEPCCDLDGEPCGSCHAEMEADAVDRLIDAHRDEEVLRGEREG